MKFFNHTLQGVAGPSGMMCCSKSLWTLSIVIGIWFGVAPELHVKIYDYEYYFKLRAEKYRFVGFY